MEQHEHEHHGVQWLDVIPPPIWEDIGKRLETRLDILRFRSVCKLWRSILPSFSLFPIRIPPPPNVIFKTEFGNRYQFFITEQTVYAINGTSDDDEEEDDDESQLPVVVVFEEVNRQDRDRFNSKALFSHNKLNEPQLPSTPNSEKTQFAKVLNMEKLSISPLSKFYQIRCAIPPLENSNRIWNFVKSSFIDKMVLISTFINTNTPTRINPNNAGNEIDLAVVALLAGGKLSLLKLEATSSMKWEADFGGDFRFDDIVNFRGRLFGVDFDGGCFVMDNYKSSLQMTRVAPSPISIDCYGRAFLLDHKTLKATTTQVASPRYRNHYTPTTILPPTPILGRKRLVVASEDLYLLFPCRVVDEGLQSKIKVFRLSSPLSSTSVDVKFVWAEVKNLSNNEALFLGRDYSFSTAVARDIFTNVGCHGNCIFHYALSFCRNNDDEDYPLFPEMLWGPSIGVYDLEDNNGEDDGKFTKISCHNCPEIIYSILPSCIRHKPSFLKG